MDGRIVRSVVFLAVSVCLLVAGISESKRVLADFFLGNGISRNSRKTNEETAEQVWIQCRKEMEGDRNGEDWDMHLPKAITDLPSQVKHTLLDCLRNRNVAFHVSAQEVVGSKIWFNKCLKLFYGWPNVPRRYLGSRAVQNRAVSHATRTKSKSPPENSDDSSHSDASSPPPPKTPKPPPPSPEPSPPPPSTRKPPPPPPPNNPEPAPSPDPPPPSRKNRKPPPPPPPQEPPPSPSPPPPSESPPPPPKTSQPPPETPKPPPSLTSQFSSRIPNPFLPQDDLNDSHAPPEGNAAPSHQSEENSAIQKYAIAGAAAIAVALLFLIVLLFVCCRKGNNDKKGPTDGQRDEKPFLNLCSSDMSPGPPPSPPLSCPTDEKWSNDDLRTHSTFKNPIIKADGHGSSPAEAHSSAAAAPYSSEATPVASVKADAPLPPPPPPPKAAPPPPPPKPPAPKPPPPPKGARPPPVPPKSGKLPRPAPPRRPGSSSSGEEHDLSSDSDARKTKLKPLFWDKVPANPDHTMVWHDIKAGSFQFNEEMMESLFGYAPKETGKVARKKDLSSLEAAPQYIQIIDAKKAQNLSIILKALNVTTEEVCDALKEGNELPGELVQSLLRMAPTTEEELKLRLFSGDLCQLGPADRFLKVMVDIPFAFKKMEALLFMSSLQSEVSSIKESFATLEVASKDLRNSRLFLKLLEAVLKTGNRMNDGTFRGGAQAFKLDTLLKLSDVKGTDGKTTLLHFVVQQIIRSEGVRAARTTRPSLSLSSVRSEDLAEDSNEETEDYYRSLGLQVVSGLSTELASVKKAALIDGDALTGTLSKLGHSLSKTQVFLDNELDNIEEKTKFRDTLANFVKNVEADIKKLLEEEKSIMAQVKSTGDYFHGNAGKDEGLRLFVVVRDFLIIVDRECKEVRKSASLPKQTPSKGALKTSQSQDARQPPKVDIRQKLFPAIMDRRMDDSDDDSFSP